jgi:hypothetical protein
MLALARQDRYCILNLFGYDNSKLALQQGAFRWRIWRFYGGAGPWAVFWPGFGVLPHIGVASIKLRLFFSCY